MIENNTLHMNISVNKNKSTVKVYCNEQWVVPKNGKKYKDVRLLYNEFVDNLTALVDTGHHINLPEVVLKQGREEYDAYLGHF
jgi:hypothetical protein